MPVDPFLDASRQWSKDPVKLRKGLRVLGENYPKQPHCLTCNVAQGESHFISCPDCNLQGFCSEECASKGHGDVCRTLCKFEAAFARLESRKTVANVRKLKAAVDGILQMASQADGMQLQALSSVDYQRVFALDTSSRFADLENLAMQAEASGMPASAKNFHCAALRQLLQYDNVCSVEMARCLFRIANITFKAGAQYPHSLSLLTLAEGIVSELKVENAPGLEELGTALKVAKVAVFLEERGRNPTAVMIAANKERVEALEAERLRYRVERVRAGLKSKQDKEKMTKLEEPEELEELEEEASATSRPPPCKRCLPCRKKRECKLIKAFAAKQKAQKRADTARRAAPEAAAPPAARAGIAAWGGLLEDLTKEFKVFLQEVARQATEGRGTGPTEEIDAVPKSHATEEHVVTTAVAPSVDSAGTSEATPSHDNHVVAMPCGHEEGTLLRSSSEAVLA